MGTPGARLQGPFVSNSALATWLPAPVATTPASMTPRSSNARRCRRPLPATGSGGEDAWSCARLLRMLIVLSLDCRIISQKPNAIPALLLRAHRDRPRGGHAPEERDEIAPPHSITSSASESRLSEILMPSALAVFKLITVSNLVGCNTGSSEGFAPLR